MPYATINPTGKLTNNAGKTLTAATLNINSNGSGTGTYVDNGTSAITSANVQQHLTTGRNWYISSPVTGSTAAALSSAGSVVYWGEPDGGWINVTSGTALNPLMGYIAVGTNATGVVTFSGTLNTGDQSITLSRTPNVNKSGFNLVGNPYPSYVNWESAAKTNIGSTIWYRTKNAGGNYVFDTFNGVGTNNNGTGAVSAMIPPMQAFWVRVNDGQSSGNLGFTNAMRAHETGTNKLKAPAANNTALQVLRLQVSNEGNTDEAILVFNENASNAIDTYDSPKMTNANIAVPEIYSVVGNEELVINGMNNFSPTTEIPVGFRTGQNNMFSIKATEISNFGAGTQVILKDNELMTEANLTDGNAYTFSSDAITTTNRFSVIFRSSSVATGVENNQSNDMSIVVFRNSNSQIVVNCNRNIMGKASISVYNAIGQKLTYKTINSTSTVLEQNYNAGVYFVSVVTNGKTITRKLIVD